MIHIPSKTDPTRGPLVSYIIPTYNRPKYLSTAIASALAQEYHNLQVIVVRDGGEDVKDVIDQFADDRLEYIDRAENWGKCRSLNQAIEHVRGKYVLYLDDDDLHYSNHVSSLVECLEGPTDCQAAYSDLNCSLVQLDANNNRKVLGKSVVVSRDYDPFFLLKYNTAPHGSTMHRTDLFEKTGLYNPEITVLIDWDIARRISFFSDFEHVAKVTGDFHTQLNQRHSDRISDMQRRDQDAFSQRCRKIVWSRPPKPWTHRKDTSIVYLLDKIEPRRLSVISAILSHTFAPYKLLIPVTPADREKLAMDYPPLEFVEVADGLSSAEKLDAVLPACDGQFVGILPDAYPVTEGAWIEPQLFALEHNSQPKIGYWLQQRGSRRAAVVRKDELLAARKAHPKGSYWRSLEMAGVHLKNLKHKEHPSQYDNLLWQFEKAVHEEQFDSASRILLDAPVGGGDRGICLARSAWSLYRLDDRNADRRALELVRQAREHLPTIDTDLIESTLLYRLGDYEQAAAGYENVIAQLESHEV